MRPRLPTGLGKRRQTAAAVSHSSHSPCHWKRDSKTPNPDVLRSRHVLYRKDPVHFVHEGPGCHRVLRACPSAECHPECHPERSEGSPTCHSSLRFIRASPAFAPFLGSG